VSEIERSLRPWTQPFGLPSRSAQNVVLRAVRTPEPQSDREWPVSGAISRPENVGDGRIVAGSRIWPEAEWPLWGNRNVKTHAWRRDDSCPRGAFEIGFWKRGLPDTAMNRSAPSRPKYSKGRSPEVISIPTDAVGATRSSRQRTLALSTQHTGAARWNRYAKGRPGLGLRPRLHPAEARSIFTARQLPAARRRRAADHCGLRRGLARQRYRRAPSRG
jgi:hypothetical protein